MFEHVFHVGTTMLQPYNIRDTVCVTTFIIKEGCTLLNSLLIGSA
jgi:hypothetical protein